MAASPASFALGPGLMGVLINVFLFGIMVAQSFIYYSRYPNDRTWMKLLVATLLVLDAANAAFDVWWVYDALVTKFADLDSLNYTTWILATDPIMVGTISSIVQLFFAWRVKVLIGNRYLVAFVVVTGSLSILAGTGTTVGVHFVPRYADFPKFQAAVIVWLVGAAVCDTTITIALTYHLRKHRTGFSGTDDILNKITRLTMQNGLITSLWAITDLIIYLTVPTGLHLAFNLPLAKLYTNSLMSSLNARTPGSQDYAGTSGLTSSARTRRGLHIGSRKEDVVALTSTQRPEVFVTVESHEMIDVDKRNMELDWQNDPAVHTVVRPPKQSDADSV